MKKLLFCLLFSLLAGTGLMSAQQGSITIDGDFDDWNYVSGDLLSEAYADDYAKYENLYAIKFCAMNSYLYFYFEFNGDEFECSDCDGKIGYEINFFDILLNTDNDHSTGHSSYLFDNSGADYLVEGTWTDHFETSILAKSSEGASQDEWAWEETGIGNITQSSDRVYLPNGHYAIEGRILIARFPTAIQSLEVGVLAVRSQDWSESGLLPQTTLSDDGGAIASPMLTVSLKGYANEPVTSGMCGDSLTWNFEDGVLTISGTGNMNNYHYYDDLDRAPWSTLGVRSVVIGEGVSSISNYAFYGCDSITSFTMHPTTPPTVDYEAFYGLDTYSIALYVPFGSGAAYRSAAYWGNFNIIEPANGTGKCGDNLTYTIADGVLTITGRGDMYDYNGNNAPWFGHNITSATMVEGATSIGTSAFYYLTELRSFTVPNSVKRIGSEAFYGCQSLTRLDIPTSVEEVGEGILFYCTGLTHLTAPANIFSSGMDREYEDEYIKEILYQSEIAFPHNIDTLILTGDTIHRIDYICIGFNSKTMRHMDLGGIANTELPDDAFNNFYNLETFVLPQRLEKIGYMAIANCISLESVTIPESVTEIGKRAFEDCRSLTSVTFASNAALTTISDWAFYNCHELKDLTLPEGVTEIGKAAFFDCTYLNEAELPATVRAIGDNAFAQCSRMEKMHVRAATPPTIDSKTFDQVSRSMPVYVPDSSVDAYRKAKYWAQMNICAESEEGKLSVSIFGKDIIINDSTGTGEPVDILGDSTLVYDPENNTLTFNSLTLEAGDSITAALSYSGTQPLTIILNDSSTIIADTVITSTSDIIITGEGILVAEGIVPITGSPSASITFRSVNMHVRSLPSSAAVRRRIRGGKRLDETGGPALSGFGSADFDKTNVSPSGAEYSEVSIGTNADGEQMNIYALHTNNPDGTQTILTEFELTAADDDAVINIGDDASAAPQKVLIDGKVLILRNGKAYTLQGVEVR